MSNELSSNRPYDILVVDDNSDDAELLLRTLRRLQLDMDIEINAQVISDSTQAAGQIKEHKFDAIFLDIDMPPPNGIELATQVRGSRINQATPIVILTGGEDRGLMTRAFQAGVNLFLFKPINRPRLQRLIEMSRVPMDRERRRLQRVKVKCKVSIEWDLGRLECETVDISLDGMLVRTKRVLPVGSAVSVTLALPSVPAPIRTPAHIVRVVGNELIGLRLENIGKHESETLAEFLVPLLRAATEGAT